MTATALVPREAAAFQSELDAVLAAPPPRLLRTTGLLAGLFATSLIAVAATIRTDVVVTGAGTLQADAPTIVLQPMERAVVRDLRVRPGDRVHRGQLLATLDATFTQADLDTLAQQTRDADAKLVRLQAELSPSPPVALPVATAERAMQAHLYASRAQEYRLRLDGYDEAMARDAAGLRAAGQAIASATSQLAIASEMVALRATLLRTLSGSRVQYLQAEDARLQAAHELDEAQGRAAEHAHALAAARAERQGYVTQWHREALDALITAAAERARLAEQTTKAARLHDLIQLAAPQDGIVLDVASRAAGSVLQPAEPLVTILPAGAALIAEINVPSADIGSVAEQDPADLKVDAFAYQQHGVLHGTVRSIGEQSLHPAPGAAMHLVRIAVTRSALHGVAKGAALIPGMTLTGEVHAGTRNLLGYFLTPITRGLADSFREP